MKKTKLTNKILSLFLALCLMVGMMPITALPVQAENEEIQRSETDYRLAENVQDGQILQAWNWSFDNIKANMAKIAEQGFTAIQTSPIQQSKTGANGEIMLNAWQLLYQPTWLQIDNTGNSPLGNKEALEAMCAEADKYGIKVIVEVVLNNMAAQTNNNISTAVDPELKDNSDNWHDTLRSIADWNNRWELTQLCLNGLPDLNTTSKTVQGKATAFLKECIDAGADGFYYDSAKHIEVTDDVNTGSDFWSSVMTAVNAYAIEQGVTLYHYGEILDKTAGGQSVTDQYTSYMSVTLNNVSDSILSNVQSGNSSLAMRSDYKYVDDATVSADKAVLWNESHETYALDGSTRNFSVADLNKTWAIIGSRESSSSVYFARPSDSDAIMGSAAINGWANPEVAAVNHFKNEYVGQEEAISSQGSIVAVERGTTGVVLTNLDDGNTTSVNMAMQNLVDGDYQDEITGNNFTVTNSTITGEIGSTGIAVIVPKNVTPSTPLNKEAPQLFMVQNTLNWSTVYAYYYDAESSGPATWPGAEMTKLDDSSDIYYILLDRGFDTVVFNNGLGSQTDDLTITEENRNTIWGADGNPTGTTYSDFTLSYFDDTASIAESGDNLVISNIVVNEPKVTVVVETATYTLSNLASSNISLSYTASGSSDEVAISDAPYDSTANTITFPKSAITHSGEVVITMQAEDTATSIELTSNGISYGAAEKPEETEQFSLPLGETYYFDLSGEVGNIGQVNTALPDETLHYVPFTYAGTINAYSLKLASISEKESSDEASKTTNANAKFGYTYDHSLFVADYNVSYSVSWDTLVGGNFLIFGGDDNYDTNFKLRSLSAGSNSDLLGGGIPANNEWDVILEKSDVYIKNWKDIYSWGQDTASEHTSGRSVRGFSSAAFWSYSGINDSGPSIGWRPALEVDATKVTTKDGLKAITLDLNDGSFNSESNIKIVSAGDNYTAPPAEGLTRPAGNTGTYFAWNTAQDGSGTNYAPGESVPYTVTTLYARWQVDTSWSDYVEALTEVDGVYTITKPEQLAWVAQQVNLGNNHGGTDFSDKTIKLANPIDLGAHQWVSIGTTSNRFAGTFDGGENEITGLYVNAPETSYVGLFGYVYNGTIKNVGVSGSVTGYQNVGGLAGYNHDGRVTDSYSSATVSGTSFRIGGVVGYNLGTIHNCANTGTVSGDKSTVGGVAGSSYGVVTNSHNTGTVNGTFNIGGVVGLNYGGTVKNSYNTGDVTGTQNSSGGVVGSNEGGTVENSYNTGDVTGTSGSSGGVVGSNYGGTVGNSYNTGVVSGTSYVGGVVGENNAGTVVNNYSAGGVSGTGNIGGVIGRNYAASDKSATVANSYYLANAGISGVGYKNSQGTHTISNVGSFASASSAITIDMTNGTTDDSGIPETNLLTTLNTGAAAYNATVTDGNYAAEWLADGTPQTNEGYPVIGSVHWGMFANAGDADWNANEITIDTEAEFAHFANLVNSGTNFGGKTITLGADLDLLGIEWVPIGTESSTFSGTFNGAGYEIDGLYINMPDADFVGLFGYISNYTTVQNIGVSGNVIGKYSVGGVVGNGMTESNVINCYNAATITGGNLVGGVIGSTEGTVENCYNIGEVTATDTSVGAVRGAVVGSASRTTVKNSYYLARDGIKGVGPSYQSNVTNVGSFASATNSAITLDSGISNPSGLPHDTLLNALNQGALMYNVEESPSISAKGWEATSGNYPVHSDKKLVADTPNITGQPTAAVYEPNDTASALTVTATGTNLSYQWYSSGSGGANAQPATGAGATSASYTPSTATLGTTYYYCMVTNTDENAIITTSTINSHIVSVIVANIGVNLDKTEVTVNGSNDTEDQAVNATAINAAGSEAGNITWSVAADTAGDEGVSIDENTGEITVSKTADTGTYTVTATSTNVNEFGAGVSTATATLTVERETSETKTVTVSGGSDTAFIPGYGEAVYNTAAFIATATDQYGDPVSDGTTWSISPTVAGVSINANTGVVSVSDAAIEHVSGMPSFTVTATNGGITGTDEVEVIHNPAKPATIRLFISTEGSETEVTKDEDGKYIDTIVKPTDDIAAEKNYTAKVYSQYGDEMSGQRIVWSFATADDHVTYADGTVSVSKDAIVDEEYILTATNTFALNEITASVTITVKDIDIIAPTVADITIKANPTYGDTWSSIVTIDPDAGSASLNGVNVPGTFSVANADTVPVVGDDVQYSIVFNSTDGDYTNIPVTIANLPVVNIAKATGPTAPTFNAMDDTANTFTFNSTSGTIYEWSKDSGANWAEITANAATTSITVGNIAIAENGLQVRVKATATHLAGASLTNATAFTATLEGSVSIGGTATYGETLTATVTGEQEGAVLTYTWKDEDSTTLQTGASNTYEIEGSAVGKTITVEVTATDYSGKIASTATAEVARKAVTAEVVGTITKEYDGNTAATVTLRIATDDKVNASDIITVTAPNAAYASSGYGDSININLGTLTIAGAAADWYTVSAPTNVTGAITKPSIAGAVVTLGASNFTYNTASQTPTVTVKLGNATLPSSEYDISYANTNGGAGNSTNAGTITVTVTAKVGGNYSGTATQKPTYVIDRAEQTGFAITAVTGKQYGDASFTLETTGGNGGGAVSYTVTAGDAITISGNTATIDGVGTVTVKATKESDGNYNQATATTSITIAKGDAPSITFPSASALTYGQKLSASILSGGSTEYGTFAWTNGDTVPTGGSSDYSVTFIQTNENYEDIADTTEDVSVTVAKATPSVNVSVAISGDSGNRTATLTATVGKVGDGAIPTGTVTFTNTTDDPDAELATVDLTNGTATYTWTGLLDQVYTFTAEYNGDSNYNTVTTADQSFDTRKQNQTGFAIAEIGAKTYGDGTFELSYSGGQGTGNVTYVSSDPTVIEIDGATATILKAGNVTITATKAADADYNAATAKIVLTVAKKTLMVMADDKEIVKGDNLLPYTFSTDGLVGSDDFTVAPTVTSPTADKDVVGDYPIIISGGTLTGADNYNISYVNGTLTVKARTYVVTVNLNGGTSTNSGANDYAKDATVTINAGSRSGYTFSSWTVNNGGIILDNPNNAITTFEMPDNAVAVTANWTQNSGGNNGGNNGGGSNNDDEDNNTTEPEVKDPETSDGQTNVDIEVKPETNNGNSSADIPDDTLEDAVQDALDEVIGTDTVPKVTIDVDTPSSADSVEVKFDSSALEDLADNENALFEIKSDVGTVSFDKTALTSILSQASGRDVTIVIREATDLTDEQKAVIGNRPTYELLVKVGSSYITNFGEGIATITLPYTLASGEEAEEVAVYYVATNGELSYMPTTYNATTRKATFTTTHFSAFTVRIINKDNPNTGGLPFTDVPTDAWYYDDVVFVYINEFMQGTSATTFEPNGTVTRAMMAQVIWNMEGNPAVEGSNQFSDVSSNEWYYDAVVWTAENGIYKGTTETTFAPNDPITREQLAAIFYRYAEYKGYDLTPRGDLSQFTDGDKVSDWATEDMMWAIGSELMFGKGDGILDPQDTATRAEIAAMIHRFVEKYELVEGIAPGGAMGWVNPNYTGVPKTGDNTPIAFMMFAMVLATGGAFIVIKKRKETFSDDDLSMA